MSDDGKNMNFNIYYLNFSKVYEISMMINNIITSNIQKETSKEEEDSSNIGTSITAELGNKFLARIKSGINAGSENKSVNSSKLIHSLEVKTTKSILLREIITKCKVTPLNDCQEGDLIKIDNVSLSILDDENLRQILVLRKDALSGLMVEGFEVNNFITAMLQDYSYLLKGSFDESDDFLILKIPMEIENEFESKYNVYDLLIGHLSIIGVYKGKVTEEFINTNTFSYFANLQTTQQTLDSKITPSSIPDDESTTDKGSLTSKLDEFHFIDIIALIQDVQFEQQDET